MPIAPLTTIAATMDRMGTPAPGTGGATTVAVLAVKHLSAAKSRLTERPVTESHRRLVLAMFDDTLAAVRAAGVDRIVVVSPDPLICRTAADRGALTVADPPAPATPAAPPAAGSDRLNAALRHGAATARLCWGPPARIAYIQADLPAVRPASLRAALARSATESAAFVADRNGTGTSVLFATPEFPPRFGPGSAAAHRQGGAVELDPGARRWPDLAADVDTPDDLDHVLRLGTGPATLAALAATAAEPAAALTGPGSTAPARSRESGRDTA